MRRYLLAAVVALGSLNFLTASPDSSFYLIPHPKKIEIKSGSFNFQDPFSINVSKTAQFYSQLLAGAIAQKLGAKPFTYSPGVARITLAKADSLEFERIVKSEKLKPPFALGPEGYVISISQRRILVIANEDAGVFYGVQTLIQLLNANSKDGAIPCMAIYDKPDMQMRGWQDDISRGPIPTMDFLKEEIRRMAAFKLNTFTLYTEHVFKLKSHPEIAPADGITAEEVEELVSFAKDYNVDVIGNFQSFGHFANILKVPGYEKLAENPSTLSPAKEESYRFLKDVYSEIAPAYNSKYFHINCDEVELGDGPCKVLIDSIGIDGVYAYHINRIDSLLKPYHKQIMMWGDIAVKNPKIIDRLPKDMIIVCWDYGPMESMDEEIMPFVKSGFRFIVAPGVSCWGRIYPDLNRATINIYNFLRDGFKHHALGFINTTWDDDGQNLFNNNWFPLAWGADCGWNAPLDEPEKKSDTTRLKRLAAFSQAYNRVYYGTDSDIASLLLAVAGLSSSHVTNCLFNGAIWNPLLPDYEIITDNYRRDNLNLIKTIDSLSSAANKLRPFFGAQQAEFALLTFALRQTRLVALRNLLGLRLRNYVNNDSMRNISYFEKDFAPLNDTIKALKPVYGKLWALENRNWWRDTVYAAYDSFPGDLEKLKYVCIIQASDTLVHGKRQITLRSAFNNLTVYYTTDGTEPTANSIKYTGPLLVDSNINLRARVIDNGKMYEVQADNLVYHKAIGKLYNTNYTWNSSTPAAYAARGQFALLDGRRGSKDNFYDGRWQGYSGTDIKLEMDFGETTPIHKITMGFGQLMMDGILFPKQIEVSTSTDGKHYTPVKTVENTIDPKIAERMTHDYVLTFDSLNARYIKVVAKNQGPLPEWHYAKGRPSWLFAAEVVVE